MFTLIFFCAMAGAFLIGTGLTSVAHLPRRDPAGRFAPPSNVSLLKALDVFAMALAGFVGGLLIIIAIAGGFFS